MAPSPAYAAKFIFAQYATGRQRLFTFPHAATGQAVAAAPPTSVMNSRRPIAAPEAQDRASYRRIPPGPGKTSGHDGFAGFSPI